MKTCEVDGVVYEAKPAPDSDCVKCPGHCKPLCFNLGPCTPKSREDRQSIIWVKQEKTND